MARLSSITPRKILGNFFVLFTLSTILLVYYTILSQYYPSLQPPNPDFYKVLIYLAFFHYTFILMLFCFLKTMLSDPGTVPPLWGFHMGDSEIKRRRYCLMCHVFKPERCHHCSVCNRCILNMDHHCPWLNNCIGFFNRKNFLLLLFYSILTSYLAITGLFPKSYSILTNLVNTSQVPSYSELFYLFIFGFCSTLSLTLTIFFKFHLKLVLTNSTTIETMDKKILSKISFDKGLKNNWEQVFGKNKALWLFPVTGQSGKPVGDGVIWSAPGTLESEEIPSDEVEKRNSSTYEEQKKKSNEDFLKDLNTASDTSRLRMELKKPLSVHSKSNSNTKSRVFEEIIQSPKAN